MENYPSLEQQKTFSDEYIKFLNDNNLKAGTFPIADYIEMIKLMEYHRRTEVLENGNTSLVSAINNLANAMKSK